MQSTTVYYISSTLAMSFHRPCLILREATIRKQFYNTNVPTPQPSKSGRKKQKVPILLLKPMERASPRRRIMELLKVSKYGNWDVNRQSFRFQGAARINKLSFIKPCFFFFIFLFFFGGEGVGGEQICNTSGMPLKLRII